MKKIDYLSSSWKTISFALSPYRGRFFFMCVLIVVGNVLGYSLPYFFKRIADQVIRQNGTIHLGDVLSSLAVLSLLLVLHEIAYRVGHVLEVYTAPEAFRFITHNLYDGLIRRPTSYFENKFSGDLGRRIEQVGNSVLYVVQGFPWEIGWVAVSVLMTVILLATTHRFILYTFLVWLAVFIITSIPLIRWHSRQSEKVATAHARLSADIIDSLANVSLIHSFGGVGHEEELNSATLNNLVAVERRVRWISVLNKFQQGSSIVVLSIALTLVSILLFARQQFTLGDFVIVAATIPSLSGVIWSAGDIIVRSSRNFGELADAVAHLRHAQDQLAGGMVGHVSSRQYPVVFHDVSFHYPATDQMVFDHFSLRISNGEHVGIVGISGAGKSSLVKLLLRQYALQQGTISIAQTPIQDFTLETFNSLISYVPQDTSLFHRTLLENISYANPSAPQERVIQASVQARAHEFIEKLPQGYETLVGERGVKLSGGQRQRIALARAILKDAPILVLDEATSSLDSESESLIQQALSDLFRDRTVIAIAHRLSTLRAMDRIIVMEAGSIVESGTPQKLLQAKTGIFKQMWEHQKNGFI